MSTYHHGDLREALLTAAGEMLEEVADVTLRGVAHRAGVSAMAPYRHFTDKKELIQAVAKRGFDALRMRLAEADAAADAREALIAQGLAYIGFAREKPALFRLMFNDLPRSSVSGDSTYGVLARRVAELVPDERRRNGTLACWATVHGIAMLMLDRQLLHPPEDDGRGAIELMVSGVIDGKR